MKRKSAISNKIIAQHNHLINAQFSMSKIELRLYISMLSRLRRTDEDFKEYRIPISEFLEDDGGMQYELLRKACKDLIDKKLHIELIEEAPPQESNSKKTKDRRQFKFLPLMAKCMYEEGASHIIVKFNEEVKPYLLQLTKNFTVAEIEILNRLKYNAYRIYLLLKQHKDFGQRTIELKELKEILGLDGLYQEYTDFKKRILIPVQEELATVADISFSFTPIRTGKATTKILFTINKNQKPVLSAPALQWREELLRLGLPAFSVEALDSLVSQKVLDTGYIEFVLQRKLPLAESDPDIGATIYTDIIKKQLMVEYIAAKPAPEAPPQPVPHWKRALMRGNISAASVAHIERLIADGEIDLGYVRYVIRRARIKHAGGKIHTSTAGLVYTNIINRNLWNDYLKDMEITQPASL